MDMTGYLGKKVEIVCKDGDEYSGYVYDIIDEEESDSGCECIELSPLDKIVIVEIETKDIVKVSVDKRYKEIDFHGSDAGHLFIN